MATLEGRSRLIHEAKPLLKRIAAPALQLQLLKQVAQTSGLTQEEAGRLTEIRGAAPARRTHPAPAKGLDRAMLNRKLDRELLACILAHPPLVREVPAEIVDVSHAEGRALEALMALDGIEELTHAVILERLRDSVHASLLNRIRGEFLQKDMDTDVARAEFDAAIAAIRTRNPNPRIKELGDKEAREGLTGQERDEFGRLIAEDAALKQRRMPPSTML